MGRADTGQPAYNQYNRRGQVYIFYSSGSTGISASGASGANTTITDEVSEVGSGYFGSSIGL